MARNREKSQFFPPINFIYASQRNSVVISFHILNSLYLLWLLIERDATAIPKLLIGRCKNDDNGQLVLPVAQVKFLKFIVYMNFHII